MIANVFPAEPERLAGSQDHFVNAALRIDPDDPVLQKINRDLERPAVDKKLLARFIQLDQIFDSRAGGDHDRLGLGVSDQVGAGDCDDSEDLFGSGINKRRINSGSAMEGGQIVFATDDGGDRFAFLG